MLETAKPYHDLGFALLLLHAKQKRPIGDDWAAKPRATWADLQRCDRDGLNLGVRLGEPSQVDGLYLHVIDMDIRDPARRDAAHAALDAALPAWRTMPAVISGSGGESRHIYLLTDQQFASKKFAHSDDKFTDAAGRKHWFWELELFGTGKQVAFPGSIHPDTGLPYRWERPFDFDDIDMGVMPFVSSEVVRLWAREKPVDSLNEDDDLLREVLEGPLEDFSLARGREVLSVFPAGWWDERDTWRDAGMALHHQFEGSEEAFDLWCELSQQSTKFDKRVQRQQWKSFKAKSGGITMRSMVRAASAEEFKQTITDEVEESLDDMIGDAPAPEKPFTAPALTYLVAPLPHDEDWRDRLVKVNKAKKAKEGEPEPEPIWVLTPGLHNTRILIQYDIRLRDVFAYNAFAQSIVLVRDARRKKPRDSQPCFQLEGGAWKLQHKRNGDAWSDSREHTIRALLETPENQGGYALKVADRDLHSAIDVVAGMRQFHPVQEYIKSETWDGVARVDSLFCDFLGCEDTPYHRQVSRMTLLAAVTRIFEPGHKFDFAPIIEGAQGKGKSTFISILAHNWFSELSPEFGDDKKMVESMKGSWIVEIGELSGFNRHDVELVKSFISRREDKVRMAYARNVGEFPRQCIFVGSTNNRRYLRDETGARRFWPIATNLPGMIDNHRLRLIIGQVWAEAYAIYQQMRTAQPDGWLPLFLSDAAAAAEAVELQESRRVETADDATLGQIQRWLDEPIKGNGMDDEGEVGTKRERTCLIEIAVECLGMPVSAYLDRPAVAQQLSRVMTRVATWKSVGERHRFDKWGRQRAYERIAV